MSVMHSDSRRQQQLEHLAHVRSLSKAVASAISAIEKNDLRQFETHLAVQETMCNRLSASASTLSPAPKAGEIVDARQFRYADPERNSRGSRRAGKSQSCVRHIAETGAQICRPHGGDLSASRSRSAMSHLVVRGLGKRYSRNGIAVIIAVHGLQRSWR